MIEPKGAGMCGHTTLPIKRGKPAASRWARAHRRRASGLVCAVRSVWRGLVIFRMSLRSRLAAKKLRVRFVGFRVKDCMSAVPYAHDDVRIDRVYGCDVYCVGEKESRRIL